MAVSTTPTPKLVATKPELFVEELGETDVGELARDGCDDVFVLAHPHDDTPLHRLLREEHTYGKWRVRIFERRHWPSPWLRGFRPCRLELAYGSNLVDSLDAERIHFEEKNTPMGTDVTSSGHAELIARVNLDSDRVSTCVVWSLNPGVAKRVALPTQELDSGQFIKEGRFTYSYRAVDKTFEFFFASHAASGPLRKEVSFEFRNNRYYFAPGLMRQPAPEGRIWQEWVKESGSQTGVPDMYVLYTGHMLDLIYTGNGNLVDKFSREAWIPNDEKMSRETYMHLFRARLRQSPYWKDLYRLNQGQGM